MLSVEKFSVLLHQIGQIDRTAVRDDAGLQAQAALILRTFVRYAEYDAGAVYLATSDGTLRRLAATEGWTTPEVYTGEFPHDVIHTAVDSSGMNQLGGIEAFSPVPRVLIPLARGDARFGVVGLCRSAPTSDADDEVLLLRAAASHLVAILVHQRLLAEVREGDFQLKYRLWELESLYDIGLSVGATLNLDELVEEILTRAVSLLNARRAALYLRKGTRFALEQSFGDVRSQFFDEEIDEALSSRLLTEGAPIRFDAKADCIFPDCESFIALPIKTNAEVVGVLAAADRELRSGGIGPFEESDIELLSRFASQAAIALENARLHREALEKQMMERELELAATIQRDILPHRVPSIDGFEIDAWTRPAKQLGGDYHALFERDDSIGFCVADVSGKSTPAALLVSALHAALQLLFAEGRDLGEIATELNRHIHHWSSQTKFITMIVATIDRDSQILRYVNAGHNPGYIVSGDRIETIKSHGLPVGMMPGTTYTTMTRKFLPGSTLVLYSDGITEAENEAGDEYGNEELVTVLKRQAHASPTDTRAAILKAVDEFAGDTPQNDDQTLVIVRRL